MSTWPASLPAPLVEGYQLAPLDQTLRTEMETGSPRDRRRTVARLDRISAAWIFDATQMAAFRSYFEDDATGLAGGTAWCVMLLDTGDGAPVEAEARFVGSWQATRSGRLWRVSATLEVR